MKSTISKICLPLLLMTFLSPEMFSDTHYVSLSGGNISPYDTWEKAATNIQDAVDVASAGDIVLVTNGTYYSADQIYVTNNITVKSFNGTDVTIISGGFPTYTNRCIYLENDAIIDGFTISNGYVK